MEKRKDFAKNAPEKIAGGASDNVLPIPEGKIRGIDLTHAFRTGEDVNGYKFVASGNSVNVNNIKEVTLNRDTYTR